MPAITFLVCVRSAVVDKGLIWVDITAKSRGLRSDFPSLCVTRQLTGCACVLCSEIWVRCCPRCPQIGACDHYFMLWPGEGATDYTPASAPSTHFHTLKPRLPD